VRSVHDGGESSMTQRTEGEQGEQGEERGGERLARFLAHAGVASRRHAEKLIASGRVQVNGVVVTAQGTRIDPAHDRVSVDGKVVAAATKHVYILLHKPVGYVSTASDPEGRPTVLDLLSPEARRLRVYPVGRLDIDTSGLLLLTNDGDFALRLTHPRYAMEKLYEVLVEGYLEEAALETLRQGVEISEDDGGKHRTAPADVRRLRRVGGEGENGEDCWLELRIHEGRKRQVRRMLTAVGHRVLQLRRVGVGPLRLGDLKEGKWRYLSDEEVKGLG
jgi:23S rRNA pseudouridine2605 synthase